MRQPVAPMHPTCHLKWSAAVTWADCYPWDTKAFLNLDILLQESEIFQSPTVLLAAFTSMTAVL